MVATESGKKYQLTIYGATGFTGSLASRYVASQYSGTDLKWAIAGRNRKKLEALRAKLHDIPDIVVADGDDEKALAALAESTEAVAAVAGPFSKYGSKLVEACVEAGCGYSDITGEADWVREMIEKYDDRAKETGARIVHFCGHDCVPWDLSVLMLNEKMKEAGDTLEKVDFYDDINSSPSGGTLETAFGIMFGPSTKKKRFNFDPLIRKNGAAGTSKTSARNVNTVSFSGVDNFKARSIFVMAGVNANAVKRSNALLNYGDITYSEGLASTSFVGAIFGFASLAFLGLAIAFPPTRFLLRKFVLPKPGEGPSEDFMNNKGYLKVTGLAKGSQGTVAKSLMTFHVDPGYKDTGKVKLSLQCFTLVPRSANGRRIRPVALTR